MYFWDGVITSRVKQELKKTPQYCSSQSEYNVTIKYMPGKEITLADAPSHVNPCAGDEITGLQITVHEIHAALNASPMRIKTIKEATAEDSLRSSSK